MSILRLKEVLKTKGISGKDLADKVGVTPNTISFMATGKTQPRFDLLLQIAEVLDVDIRDLFYSTKEEPQEILYIKKGDQYVAVGNLNINSYDR